MSALSVSKLKSLTLPFATEEDAAEATQYWAQCPADERNQADLELMGAFYRERGLAIDTPMERTIRPITLEEMNLEHEEWHRDFARFHASR